MATAEIIEGFIEIFKAPFEDPSVLWLIIPLLVIWAVIDLYFVRYREEELGWNTALGNAFSLFWVGAILSKYLFETKALWPKFIVPIAIIVYSLILIFVVFKHKLPKVATSPTVANYFVIVCILWVYGLLKINLWVLFDLAILFAVLASILLALKKVVSKKEDVPEARPTKMRMPKI